MESRITLEQLIEILDDAKKDYYKFYGKGNKSAATRLRKSLQDVVNLSKDMRKQVIDYKKEL